MPQALTGNWRHLICLPEPTLNKPGMSYFIDGHCHPTLKHYLYGHSPLQKSNGTPDLNYTNIQVTEPSLRKAGVQAVLAAHYLPEKMITEDWKVLAASGPVQKFLKAHTHKFEKADAFAQALGMIDEFEAALATSDQATIARNFSALEQGIAQNKTVFIHTIEGAHQLGRGLEAQEYVKHIGQLEQRGVAMLTLCHFYPNDITTPTEGLPPGQKKLLGMQYTPQDSPLTSTGRKVVEALLKSRIIVDLTHTNPTARKEIFDMNEEGPNRPLVFSHTGVRALFKDKEHPHFSLISPDDEELLRIRDCNGLAGVVWMNYFLCGREEKPLSSKDEGLKLLLATIRHIVQVTGSFDHVAIGTDMDGMIDPPDDLYDCSMLGTFRDALFGHKEYLGATDADIEKILGGNITRVLKEVWQ